MPHSIEKSHLGIMPPAMMPSATSSLVDLMSSSLYLVETSSLSFSTPGTSVMRMSFSAWRAAAICRPKQAVRTDNSVALQAVLHATVVLAVYVQTSTLTSGA